VERWWGGRGDDDANMNEKNNDLNSEEEYWWNWKIHMKSFDELAKTDEANNYMFGIHIRNIFSWIDIDKYIKINMFLR
jgi:hypothetical protein